MNRTENLERELTAWFVDTAAPRTPDYTDDIVRLTAGLAQRPRWAFPERWFPMSVITLARRTVSPVPWRTVGVLAVIALLIAAMLAVYIGGRPKAPPPFGLAPNGLIAYTTSGDILTIDPNTGLTTTLVDGPEMDNYPQFSPDGTKIVFERDFGGGSQLYVVDAAGGAARKLTETEYNGFWGLVWSPDGKQLAYVNGALMIVAADGSGAHPVETGASTGGFPMWRPPNGDDILFSGTKDGASGSLLVHRDGSGLRLMASSPSGGELAMWTPDGNRIVITQTEPASDGRTTYRVHVYTLDQQGLTVDDAVVGPPLERGWSGYGLSPDGTRSLVSVRQPGGADEWRVGVMSIDGPSRGAIVETGPVLKGSGYGYTWSPDGTTVLLTYTDKGETWLLDANGGTGRLASWFDANSQLSWQRGAR
jgi:Tol biopolymer transport system component